MGRRPGNSNSLRIIGGEHRGRRLRFPDARGLRPTADRVRETLFNWLAPQIHGARCLDLFAGSGALGLESLSRGAREVLLLDSASAVVSQLQANVDLLDGTGRARVKQVDALRWLDAHRGDAPFDIVFVDPPFADRLQGDVLQRLRGGLLHDDSLVYVERDQSHAADDWLDGWQVWRERRAGSVDFMLLRLAAEAGAALE